ncbi:MAG: amidohydrolase family protein [Deltaproteobacteria bacterium]|nr:amidohydrolase family protein [Deltaproteobacteria bacterium]
MKCVTAAWILPLNHQGPIPNGAMVIDGDTILAVGTAEAVQKQFPQAQNEDHPESVLMPGLVNAHCHLDRIGFYEKFSVATDTQFSPVVWLLESLHYLSTTSSGIVAKQMETALTEMLQTGITCLGVMSHYEGTYPLVKTTPLRGVIFHEILSGPDKRAQQRFEIALALVDQYREAKPGHLQIGFGPYAPYLLSKNLLNIISRHAKDLNLPLQIHAAEHFAEMEFFFESKGPIAEKLFPAIGWEELPPAHRKTPIQHLDEIGFMATPLSIVGAYQMAEKDFPRLARGLSKVVYCPSANRRFNLGRFPLKKLQKQGVPVALGTELLSNTHGFDLWDEMRLALKEGSNPLPTPSELLKMATLGGAYALGFEKETGSLEKGKKADYLLVKSPHGENLSAEDLVRELILQTTASSIEQVTIDGKKVA